MDIKDIKKITLPIKEKDIEALHSGDIVYISGPAFTARDKAHERLVKLIKEKKPLPINLDNACIYYVGPTPKTTDGTIKAAGPTSSYRMDEATLVLLDKGLKLTIGKGARSIALKEALVKNKAIYISAIGGAATLAAKTIKSWDLVCYEDLGAEAIYKIEFDNFLGIVTYDIYGVDLIEEEIKKYKK